MTAVLRAWLGFCALGAALVHLALVVGAHPAVAVALLGIGGAEFGWGVLTVASSSLPVPRLARIAALIPILGWALLLAAGGTAGLPGMRVLPMVVAGALDLAVALGVTVVLRRRDRPSPPWSPRRYLLAVGAGALVVAALTVPAVAATDLGEGVAPAPELPAEHPAH